MVDRNNQYAIVVKAPSVALRPLEGSDWVILEMTDRRDLCELRFARVQKFLMHHPKSQVVVYSFPKDDIGKVRCIGNTGARDVPPLRAIRLTDKAVRDAFWFKVDKSLGIGRAPVKEEPRGLSWKAIVAIAVAAFMTAAVPVAMITAQAGQHQQVPVR